VVFEHIPWSELSAAADGQRNRLLFLAGGVIVAVVVGALVARAVWSPVPRVEEAPPVTASPAAAGEAAAPATMAAPEVTVPATLAPPPSLLSEADLMAAVTPPDAAQAAIARAEWFVVDYFTSDIDPRGATEVRAALPAGTEALALPQEIEAPDSVSFVEWARAFRVEADADGTYRVGVVFRTIGARGDGGFRRLPVRAVEVPVKVGQDGGAAVADLPQPIAVPPRPAVTPLPAANDTVPGEVATAALDRAGLLGSAPNVVGGSAAGAGWRVVVTVEDEMGNRWPVAVTVGTG